MKIETPLGCWKIGTPVRKIGEAYIVGRIVGYYSTETTDVGYCVEFQRSPVETFPASAIDGVERDPPILVGDITPFVHHLPLRKPTIKVKRLATTAAAVKVKDGE